MDATAMTVRQQESSRRVVIAAIAAVAALYFCWRLYEVWLLSPRTHGSVSAIQAAVSSGHDAPHTSHAPHPPPPALYSILPFAALLLAIALLPLLRSTAHWWEHNRNRFLVAAGLAAATLGYYAFVYGEGVVDHVTHELSDPGLPAAVAVLKNALLVEYVPFITLLFSLYVISGGILIEGDLAGRPKLNAGLIGLGGLLASFIGTTGAAMLLIRPLLRANAGRRYVAHTVVFFIFVACNTGGCLLPIGDPPLFLGFLRGVPFTWTLSLWPMWLFMNVTLLAVYLVWDTIRYRQEHRARRAERVLEAEVRRAAGQDAPEFVKERGLARGPCAESREEQSPRACLSPFFHKLPARPGPAAGREIHAVETRPARQPLRVRGAVNVLWLLGVIACVGLLDPSKTFPGTNWRPPVHYRELVMLSLAALSLQTTSARLRQKNSFSYHAILEVAALFVGIFVCMQAPIQLLQAHGGSLGIERPWEFYWGTGALSSFLDNAPTYVVFFETARALEPTGASVAGVSTTVLVAISLGAVFMGAMTYIGNGPNFIVKSIAETSNVRMPGFFGYMAYSAAVLLPLSLVLTLLFL